MLKINDLGRHHAPLMDELHECARAVLASGWFVLGPQVEAFELSFAKWCGTAHSIGVANGTDALELALRAVGVGDAPGDEVINVANAGMYTTAAILAVGAIPRFVDIRDDDLSIDRALVSAALTPATRAIVVTHLYGHLADIAPIAALAAKRGIALIEDCAQAHGAASGGRKAGTFGAIGCFSFYPTKNLGALGASNAEIAARLRSLRQYGWSSKYEATVAHGRNSRLDELQAAMLSVKLPHLDAWNGRRTAIAARYSQRITHASIRVPRVEEGRDVAHLYVVRCVARDTLRAHLARHDVAADVHYPVPDHHQPMLASRCAGVVLPVTERACAEVLSLPCFPEMTDAEVDQVAGICNAWSGA